MVSCFSNNGFNPLYQSENKCEGPQAHMIGQVIVTWAVATALTNALIQ